MDVSFYFQPLELNNKQFQKGQIGAVTQFHNTLNEPDLETLEGALVIMGVQEDRGSTTNVGSAAGSRVIRKHLYQLYTDASFYLPIVDIGDIYEGEQVSDSYFAVSSVCSFLIKRNNIPIVLGGSHDLTYANYLAYESLEQIINLLTIDRKFDFGTSLDARLTADTYLSKIMLHQPNYLFHYTNLAYQTYFVSNDLIEFMDQLHFDAVRLGNVRADVQKAEPHFRNADMVSFDVSAIRSADSPGAETATPNGLTGEEACQLMRYAGISDKVSSLGLFEYNPSFDDRERSAQLIAQMLWYFIEGVNSRKNDNPLSLSKDYVKYRVAVNGLGKELVFLKSLKTDRWWMDVPFPGKRENKYKRHQIIPCTYEDYLEACSNEVPQLWLKTYQKFL